MGRNIKRCIYYKDLIILTKLLIFKVKLKRAIMKSTGSKRDDGVIDSLSFDKYFFTNTQEFIYYIVLSDYSTLLYLK